MLQGKQPAGYPGARVFAESEARYLKVKIYFREMGSNKESS
jgi:hypothetical protein